MPGRRSSSVSSRAWTHASTHWTRPKGISTSAAGSTSAPRRRRLRRPDLRRSPVLLQHRGNLDRPVLALEVFEHREEPAVGRRGAVERVYRLRPAVRPIANLQPTSLEVGCVRARGDLAVALLAREPSLDVVLPRSRRAEVT